MHIGPTRLQPAYPRQRRCWLKAQLNEVEPAPDGSRQTPPESRIGLEQEYPPGFFVDSRIDIHDAVILTLFANHTCCVFQIRAGKEFDGSTEILRVVALLDSNGRDSAMDRKQIQADIKSPNILLDK